MSSGTNATQTTETKTNLSEEQEELLSLAMPGVREFAASTPERYQGSQVADFTKEQVQGQEQVLEAAKEQGKLATNLADATNFYTSGNIWDPSVNPYLQGAVDASVRPIYQNLNESTLPTIRGEAVTTGNFGSSRQGIAEGLASGRASQAAGDTASKLVQSQYETNVNAQLKAMGLVPTAQSAQTVEGTTTSGVGDVRQAMEQSKINEAVSNWNYDELAPFLQSQEIISLLQGLPGGSTTSTSTGNSTKATTASQALGSAAAGASLGTAIMPGVGTALGAAGGAVLPFVLN